MAVDPKFILLDEPFAGVDPIAVEDIQGVVAKLKYKNIGILITDHNVNETLSICDRAYLMIEGKIFMHGTAEELAADDKVRRLYLGTNFELKRKDWLIELGQNTRTKTTQEVLIAISKAIKEIERFEKKENDQIGYKNQNTGEIDEMEAEDFIKYLTSVHQYIRHYSDSISKEKLDLLAEKITDGDFSYTKSALNDIQGEIMNLNNHLQ